MLDRDAARRSAEDDADEPRRHSRPRSPPRCSFLMSDAASYMTRQVHRRQRRDGADEARRRYRHGRRHRARRTAGTADRTRACGSGATPCVRMPEWDYFESCTRGSRARCPASCTPGALSAQEDALRWAACRCIAVRASELALADAGLPTIASIADGRMGVAYGSSSGIGRSRFARFGTHARRPARLSDVTSNSYVQMMPHTTRGQRQPLLGPEGADHSDVVRVRVGQPGDRLRVRGDPGRQADADARRRRGGTVAPGGRGLRHAVCDQHAQRRAATDAAAVRFARDGLVVGEGAGDAGARGAASMRGRAARRIHAEIVGFGCNSRRRAHHAADRRHDGARDAARAATTPASRPTRSAMSTRTARRPSSGDVAEKPGDARGVRRAHADQLAEELRRPYARRVRRARSVVHASR